MESMWMEAARGSAAQCWCDPKNSHKVMDPDLCESVALRLANWMETAAQNQRNTDYYRGLLDLILEGIMLVRSDAGRKKR